MLLLIIIIFSTLNKKHKKDYEKLEKTIQIGRRYISKEYCMVTELILNKDWFSFYRVIFNYGWG